MINILSINQTLLNILIEALGVISIAETEESGCLLLTVPLQQGAGLLVSSLNLDLFTACFIVSWFFGSPRA